MAEAVAAADTSLLTDLNIIPRHNKTHQWADYVEILALTSQDQLFSSGLLEDAESETEDFSVDRQDFDVDVEESGPLSMTDLQQEDQPAIDGDAADIRNHEKLNRRWADIKACLQSRDIRFGDAWPFELEGDVLRVAIDGANTLHRLYVALLIASALKWVPDTRRPAVTASLEEIGFHLFKKLMPDHWTVAPFGAHQTIEAAFTGTLFNKFSQLAAALNAHLIIKEDELDPRDTGDGGLDIVAYHSFNDSLGHLPVAFAQCGCSLSDMKNKQFEPTPINMNLKVLAQHPGASYYFAPQDIRKNNGSWEKTPVQVIMIDRARILYLAGKYGLDAAQVSWPHVDEAISLRREVLS